MERKDETEEGVVLPAICRFFYCMTLRKVRCKSSNIAMCSLLAAAAAHRRNLKILKCSKCHSSKQYTLFRMYSK